MEEAGFYILEQIGSYPFDLFKLDFDPVIESIVKADVNKFCAFLDSRSKQLNFLKSIDSGNVINQKVTIFTENNLWQVDKDHILEQTQESKKFVSGYLQLSTIGDSIVKALDIKDMHKPVKIGKKDRLNMLFDEL